MIIDTKIFSCLTCDAPEAWQAGLSEPASITMEGILIFNNHLLFLLIVIILFVGWLLYNTIFFYEEFNNKFNSKFVHSKGLKRVCDRIPATLLIKNNFYLKENSQEDLKKKKYNWDPVQERLTMYNFIFLILILVSIQFSQLFISCYVTVAFLYYKFHWAQSHKSYESDSNWFSKLKNKISEFFDLLQFYVNEYRIILLFISFLFSIFRENYIVAFYFVILLGLSKKFEAPQFFLDKMATFRNNIKTIKIRKKTDFKLITQWLNITWVTLFVSFLLSPTVRSSGMPEGIYFMNGTLWFLSLWAALLINLILEINIILYSNMPIADKAVQICFKCAASGLVAVASYQIATEEGYIKPNEASNRIRTTFSDKAAIQSHEDAEIDTIFRRIHLDKSEYTTSRESTLGGGPMDYVDSTKVEKIVSIPENAELIKKIASEKGKIAVGLAKPRKGIW